MESLDIFAKSKVQFNRTGNKFKTKIGGYLTLLQGLISIIIVVFLANRNFENKINSNWSQRSNEYFRNTSYAFLIKFPKIYSPYIRWIDEFPLQLSNSVKPCNDEQYSYFYNDTKKDDEMEYLCIFRKELYFHIFDIIQVAFCSQIEKISLYDAIKDTLNCNIEIVENEPDISNFDGEYWLQTYYYNETSLSDYLEVKKEKFNFSNIDRSIGNTAFHGISLRLTHVNINPFVDEIKHYTWLDVYRRNSDYTSDFLFCLILYVDNPFVKTISSVKINEKLVTILTILSIVNIFFKIISKYLSKFFFEIYVLENCFSKEELVEICKKLSLDETTINTNDKIWLANKIKSNFYKVTNLVISDKNFCLVKDAIIKKLAIEQFISQNYSTSLDKNDNKSCNLNLDKFDIFSDSYKININKANVVKSELGGFFSLIFLSLSGLIIYYFSNNLFTNKNPKVIFNEVDIATLEEYEKSEYDPNTIIMISVTEEFSKMTIPVLAETKGEYPYKTVSYRNCTLEEIESFNLDFPPNKKLAHICFNLKDVIDNFYGDTFMHAIHFVNCTSLSYLGYLESDCSKDLLNLGDPIFVRLDIWSYSINHYNEEYKTKIHMNVSIPNMRYDYNKHYFTPEDMNDPWGFYREYKEYHSYFVLTNKLLEFYDNKNKLTQTYEKDITYTTTSIYYYDYYSLDDAGNLLGIQFLQDATLLRYYRTNDTVQNVLATVLTICSLIMGVFYVFYSLFSDLYIMRKLIKSLDEQVLKRAFYDKNKNKLEIELKSKFENTNSINAPRLKICDTESKGIVDLNNINSENKSNLTYSASTHLKSALINKMGVLSYINFKISPNKLTKENLLFDKTHILASFETIISTSEHIVKPKNNGYVKILDFQSDIESYVTINNDYEFKTVIGGLFSIIFFILIIPVIILNGKDFIYKTNPTIESYSTTISDLKINEISYYFGMINFNYVIYYDKLLDHDMKKTYIVNREDYPPELVNNDCSDNQLKTLFDSSEYKQTNMYKCHDKKTLFPIPMAEARIIILYQNKCLDSEANCNIPEGEFNIGLRLNYTKPIFDNYNDFLKSTIFKLDLNSKILNFPFLYVELQINIFRNDIGIFQEQYEEHPYIWKQVNYLGRSGQISFPGTIESYLIFYPNTLIYTRKYQSLTKVINESYSILVVIATIFKLTSNYLSKFYSEKYLIKLLLNSHNEKVNSNNLSNQIQIKDDSKSDLCNNIRNSELKINQICDVIKPFKVLEEDECIEKNKNNQIFEEKIIDYDPSFFEYVISTIPYSDSLVDSKHSKLRNMINEFLSLENILMLKDFKN